MVAPRPKLGDCQRSTLTYSMLITHLLRIWLEGHRQPRKKVESLSSTEGTIGFESETFRFGTQRLNPLHHLLQLTFWFLYITFKHIYHIKLALLLLIFNKFICCISSSLYSSQNHVSFSVYLSFTKNRGLLPLLYYIALFPSRNYLLQNS